MHRLRTLPLHLLFLFLFLEKLVRFESCESMAIRVRPPHRRLRSAIEDHVGSVPTPDTGMLIENGMAIPKVIKEFEIRVGSGSRSQTVF